MVSVIVCCYNSVTRLPDTLRYLAQQKVPLGFSWEVILVDNNSSDSTAQLAEHLWSKYQKEVPMKIVYEQRKGLSFARKKGVEAAKYEIVLFCDDDNWLSSSYLYRGFQIMDSNEAIGALGGYSSLATKSEYKVPNWFKENAAAYAVGKQAVKSGDITSRKYLWGAGIFLRKSLLVRFSTIGVRHAMTGRTGGALLAGDDSEICAWVIAGGYLLWYSDDLHLRHFMPDHRLQKDYYDQMMKGLQEAYQLLTIYWKGIEMLSSGKSLVMSVKYIRVFIKACIRKNLSLEDKIILQANIPPAKLFDERFNTIVRNLKLIEATFER